MIDEPPQQPDFVGVVPEKSAGERQEVGKLSENIARLERDINTEKEERLEERFLWICIMSLLLDILAISAVGGSWLFLPVFALQLIVLIGFAKVYGVDWAEQLIGGLLYRVLRRWNKDE